MSRPVLNAESGSEVLPVVQGGLQQHGVTCALVSDAVRAPWGGMCKQFFNHAGRLEAVVVGWVAWQ